MPSVLIDDALYARLRESAAANRRSPDDEARELLRLAVARQQRKNEPRENIVDAAKRLFGPENGVELDIPPRGSSPGRPPLDFSDH